MPLLFLPSKPPGIIILLGSVMAWGVTGIGLRALGVADPVATVIVGVGGGLTLLIVDARYRSRRGIAPFDLTRSSVWFIPTWLWAFALFLLAPVALRAP